MPYLELQKLQKKFGDFTAIHELDVALEAGEFLSLLGPSGCGKTTALRIVAGFERPTSGRVVVEGKDLTNVPANKRDMGMVFQAYSLFPNMTAEANVEFGLRIRGESGPARRTRVEELLELVGLTAAAKRYPHQLSGGMQQRVALARALAIEPRVLLLDEPLSALDAKVRVQLREEIRRLQTQLGITTLYVTHDQEEALSISDRVAVLSHGRIEQIGSPAEIYNAPGTPFVAEFIGTMNRLEATVAESGQVQVSGSVLAVDDAHDLPRGERVLVLVRPEILELERAEGGVAGAIIGEVVAHIFLGAITRVKVDAGDHELSADLPGHKAAELPGRRGARPRAQRASVRRASAGRSVKIPVTPSAASSSIRAGSLTVKTVVASPAP
jgi:putative spermidine/putrescine transport system ATP-binding protein